MKRTRPRLWSARSVSGCSPSFVVFELLFGSAFTRLCFKTYLERPAESVTFPELSTYFLYRHIWTCI